MKTESITGCQRWEKYYQVPEYLSAKFFFPTILAQLCTDYSGPRSRVGLDFRLREGSRDWHVRRGTYHDSERN